MATASSLGVWLDGIRVADLEQPRWPRIRLRYSEEALDRWPQNKPGALLFLVRLPDGRWGRPLKGRPSTHILKLDDTRCPGPIQAEGECLALARALDLTTVEVGSLELGGHDCLIVSRFDRAAADDGEVRRIHQEDLCQALGLDPTGARGRAKYEQGRAGPSLRQLLASHPGDGLARPAL